MPLKEIINIFQCSLRGQLLDRLSTQTSCNEETKRSTDHGATPGQQSPLPKSEQCGVRKGNQKGGKRCHNGL